MQEYVYDVVGGGVVVVVGRDAKVRHLLRRRCYELGELAAVAEVGMAKDRVAGEGRNPLLFLYTARHLDPRMADCLTLLYGILWEVDFDDGGEYALGCVWGCTRVRLKMRFGQDFEGQRKRV